MIARYSVGRDGQEIELSTLDLTSGTDDGHGGVVLSLGVWATQYERTEWLTVEGKPGLHARGKRYRSKLKTPVMLTLRLDVCGLHALAAKALRSRSGKAKSGPVTVRGGRHATWTREDLE